MANPTHPPVDPFRAELDDGQIVEADGSTIVDPASGAAVPAVLLRMSRARAHTLAHILDDWSRVAFVFATLRSSQVTERALAWTLDAGAAAAGDPEAAPVCPAHRRSAIGGPATGRRHGVDRARTAGSPPSSASPSLTRPPAGWPKTPARNSLRHCCRRCAPRPPRPTSCTSRSSSRPGVPR